MRAMEVLLALVIGSTSVHAREQGLEEEARSAQVTMPGIGQYDFPDHSLRLQLPDGWAAFEVDFSVMHYRDVFLCVNSIGSRSLQVEGSARDTRLPRFLGAYNAEVVAEQLPPGTAYVDIGFFEGPGGTPHFSGNRRDDFESSVESMSPSRARFPAAGRARLGHADGARLPLLSRRGPTSKRTTGLGLRRDARARQAVLDVLRFAPRRGAIDRDERIGR